MEEKDPVPVTPTGKKPQSVALSGLFTRNSIWSFLSLLSSSKRGSLSSKHSGEHSLATVDDSSKSAPSPQNIVTGSQSDIVALRAFKIQPRPDRGVKAIPTIEDFADTTDESSEASRSHDPIVQTFTHTSMHRFRRTSIATPGAGSTLLHQAESSSEGAPSASDDATTNSLAVNVTQVPQRNELQVNQNQSANAPKQPQLPPLILAIDSPKREGLKFEKQKTVFQYEPYDSDSVLENYLTFPRSSAVFENNSTFLEEFDESKSSAEGNSFHSLASHSRRSFGSHPPTSKSPNPPIYTSSPRTSKSNSPNQPIETLSFPTPRHPTTPSLSSSSGTPSLSSSTPSDHSQARSSIEGEDSVPIRRRPLSPQFRSFQIPSIMEEEHPTPSSSIGSIQLSPTRDHFNITSFNSSLVNHSSGSGGSGGSSSGGSRVRNAPARVSSQPENRQSVNYEGMEKATIVRTHSLTHARSVRQKPNLVSVLRLPSSSGSPGQRDSNASGSMDNSQSTTGDDISMSTGELLSQLNDAMGAAESETLLRTGSGIHGTNDRKSLAYAGLRSSIISHPSRAYHVSSDFTSDPFQKKAFEVPTPPSRRPSGSSGSYYSVTKANVTLPITNVEILREYEHQDDFLTSQVQLPPFTKEHSLSSDPNSPIDMGRTRNIPHMPIGPQIVPSAVVSDRLRKQNSHEDMIAQRDNSTTSYHDNFSDDFNDDLQDTIDVSSSNDIFDEKHVYDPARYFNFYPWWYFGLLMILGLVVPPVYFLISCGVFDVNNRYKQFRLNYYFQGYAHQHKDLPRRVKFTRTQKWISFIFGLFWVSVVLSMIGTSLGIVLTRKNP